MRGDDDEADNEEEEEVDDEGLVDLEEEEEGVHAVAWWDRLSPHRLLKKPERLPGRDEVRTPRGVTLLLVVVVVRA